ncbi:hypothetical protein EWB00_005306 [Schistosoma japonicum]|uniref:Uncharacterized protein n=1 Tax=Schistosoma japonicum TaxID=6182 RepID=A0A4Z2D1Y4_SCHJA|nr:hypothetical protein EWB00_005306 [Schistosoma japonicum]
MNVASIRFLLPPIVAIIMSINMSDNLVVNLTDSSDILVVNSTESPSHERHFWPFRHHNGSRHRPRFVDVLMRFLVHVCKFLQLNSYLTHANRLNKL